MDLEQSRMAAAMQSGGVSSSVIYQAILTAAHDAFASPASILDFGSGTGQLLAPLAARFHGATLHAVDIMDRPAELPASVVWHTSDLNDQVSIASASFDMIVAAEVIEHLENPRHMIREIARMLTPGGVAVLSTPNTGSIRSLMTFAARGHHAQFDDTNYPAHITPVSDVDFARMGEEAGLRPERFFFTDSGTIPKLLSRRWQNLPVIGSRLHGKRFSDNFGVVLRKPVTHS